MRHDPCHTGLRTCPDHAQTRCLTHADRATAAAAGATPDVLGGSNPTGGGLAPWSGMYHTFMHNRDGFLADDRKRSNVETALGVTTDTVGGAPRSETKPAQVNELPGKVFCHPSPATSARA